VVNVLIVAPRYQEDFLMFDSVRLAELTREDVCRDDLRKYYRAIHADFEDFETEEIILYPHVEERLKKLGITYYVAHRPDNIPSEQI